MHALYNKNSNNTPLLHIYTTLLKLNNRILPSLSIMLTKEQIEIEILKYAEKKYDNLGCVYYERTFRLRVSNIVKKNGIWVNLSSPRDRARAEALNTRYEITTDQ